MFETTNQIYIYIDELSSNIIDSPYLLVKILVSFSAKKGALEKAFTQVSTEQIELKLGKSPSWYNHQITRKQKTQFYQNTYSNRFLKPVVHGIFPDFAKNLAARRRIHQLDR
jgi:trehalose-6-phosphate synthase